MQDILLDLLRRQQASGFPDLKGAEAAATIPIGDGLINEAVARTLARDSPVQDVRIQSEAGGQLKVSLRLASISLLPAISVTLAIDEQPDLPGRPILGLRLSGLPRLLVLTGALARFRDMVPPGIAIDGEHIRLNLETLLEQRGQADLLRYLAALNVTTRDGAVVVSLRSRIP